MFSQAKHIDKLLLLEIGELVSTLTRHVDKEGVMEQLDFYTKQYEIIEQRINTFDYTRIDELLNYKQPDN
jgi:hypothetical protein